MNSISSPNNNQKSDSNSEHQTKNSLKKNHKETKSPVGSPSSTSTNLNYAINSIKCTRKKNNLNKVSKPQKSNNIKNKDLFSLECLAYSHLSKKYNFTLKKFNLLCIHFLLSNRSCRLVSVFKENMITDYVDEFLKRQYFLKESEERIPKFYLYYKHYSIFFGQPFFTDFSFNVILQKNGEKKARIYYKNHYQNGESKDEDNENIGFAESMSDDDDEEKKNNNEDTNKKKKNKNNTIFSECIKDNIDNITVMTTINSIENNNTINLGLNNEKIEIFSENKMEKSNDTTIGELMDDINKGIEEAYKSKNHIIKKKKDKNFSLGDNFCNLLKKNINSNAINENIQKNKKKLINNNNNVKNKLKNNSIKKKLFYVGHKNANLNNNGAFLASNTQRYNHKKNNISIKGDLNNKKNNISSNRNLNSNKAYKKRKLLSYTNEEVNKIINPNYIDNPKSPRHITNKNTNSNYLNTINANPAYGSKKLNDMRKINSPLQINKKLINSINTNSLLTSLNNNHNNNKIKICQTLKSFVEQNRNKPKKNITKNFINKKIGTISGERKKKINKISFKKFELENLTETQIFREKHINKKTKGRNILSPLNNKYIENYTMTNESSSINNNLPFSANKNKNSLTNHKIFNNNVIFNNLSYQTINWEQAMGHQRTKSNLIQNNFKKNNFAKVMNTEMNNAYIKPAIRIKKNDKLYMSRPVLNDMNTDNNFDNKTIMNTNNILNSKKLSNNNIVNYLSNCVINNTNTSNETKNNNNTIYNNTIYNNSKNTNFNKYLLEVIKKSKHQHFNSINQVNPVHTLNSKDNKKKLNINNTKTNKDREVFQIALSLLLNENTSRNIQNHTNILEASNNNNNNNFSTYCKINNNQTKPKNQNNNHKKRNYNLNININNEININENNTINNSTYINHTHRLNSKNLGGATKNLLNNYFGDNSKQKEKNKYIINLKQKKYNIDAPLASNRNNNCQSTKNNNINDNPLININNKKGKKIKTRNKVNKNLNNALTSNNNLMKTVILNNNSVDNNKTIGTISNKNNHNNSNNKNNNIIKSYHTKSVTSLSDLMYHNKKLISLYKNLSKSK